MKRNAVHLLRVSLSILLLSLLAHLARAEQIELKVPAGLVELKLSDPIFSGADISWEAKQPATLLFKGPYDQGTVIVFNAPSAGQYVVVADVIDWEAKKRTKTTWVVTVEGPLPPNPPQPPLPGPVVPRPTGLAGEVYDKALPLNQPAVCRQYSARLDSVISQIGAGALRDLAAIQTSLRSAMAGIALGDPGWKSFNVWINSMSNNRPETNTVEGMKAFLTEISKGLEAAGGGR